MHEIFVPSTTFCKASSVLRKMSYAENTKEKRTNSIAVSRERERERVGEFA